MVCEKCQKKLGSVITPDPWKSGARNTVESGGRKVNENKALTGSKARFDPVGTIFRPCRLVLNIFCSKLPTNFLNFIPESVNKKYINLDHIIVSLVHIKKEFVQCAVKNY